MKKIYLINLILILIIAGLYWFNLHDNQAKTEMEQLTTLSISEIHHIAISRPGSVDIELEKSTSGWQITKPIKAIANTKRIELLLSFLETPSYAQMEVDNNTMLSQFELKPANFVLTLNNYSVKFGGIEPISKHRYALIDNMIHLITDRITPLLSANAASFIENKLISNKNNITKLTLPLRDNNNTLLTKSVIIENNNGHWQSNLPTMGTDKLTAFVENWQHAYALQVLPLKTGVQETASSHKVQIFFHGNNQATEYDLKLSGNTLFILDHKQQLSYQFSHTSLAQLLPSQPTQP